MHEETVLEKRFCIGLMVSHLDTSYDALLCEGAMEGAKQMDVNLVILPGRYINGVYADKIRTTYEYQYNTLFSIPAYCKLDALLVLIGTLGNHLDFQERKAFLAQYGDIPIITLSCQQDGYPCIQVDNQSGLDQLIQHLISVHGCDRIGFISGPSTNAEANLRLAVYRSVLERNGIAHDPNRVIYGNFSKYCTDKVEELLDRCPDLQAIACANDQMALAVYEVLEKRGLRPGKDILVTGFDNDRVAQEMNPKLSTVAADVGTLGREAVIEAVNYIKTGKLHSAKVPADMVLRNSCGCQGNPRLNMLVDFSSAESLQANAGIICDFLMAKCRNADVLQAFRGDLTAFVQALYDLSSSDNLHRREYRERVLAGADQLLRQSLSDYVNPEDLYSILEYGYKAMMAHASSPEDLQLTSDLFIQIYRKISEKYIRYMQIRLDDDYFANWQSNSITRDMLLFDAYDDHGYLSVTDKLQRLHMRSSYLFAYAHPIVHAKEDEWLLPGDLYLKSYHNENDMFLLPPERQRIPVSQLLEHPYLPQNRRYTLLVMPLFSAKEHFGLLMCEVEYQYLRVAQSISLQLSAALKTIDLIREQAVTQKKLRQSLIQVRESNQLLNELSRTDQLTLCLNRRGFYEEMRQKLQQMPLDSVAYLIMADLDSLKVINDWFGHSEGDFAIRSAAEMMRQLVGEDGLVARMGGDEFIGCMFPTEPTDAAWISNKLEEIIHSFNERNTKLKAYRVHISAGVFPFQCSDTVEIGDLISHADALLYVQKRNKKSILRDPEAIPLSPTDML